MNSYSINRRGFITRGAVLAGAIGAVASHPVMAQSRAEASARYKLHYAPHPGTFKAHVGTGVLDEIQFMHDQGFTAFEYNGLPGETPAMQEQIGRKLAELGMKMGVFVAYASFDEPTFAVHNPAKQDGVLKKIRAAVDIAGRVGAKWFTVVPGSVDQQAQSDKWNKYGGGRLNAGYQTANAIELLRRCAAILEPHGLVMVLEPLNWQANHGGVLLRYSDQAYALCKAVNSPSCKILFDIYHQQISEGNLIPNINRCWDEIAYFQSGDNPGRKEPGTGEINYRNVFKYIHDRSRKENREFVIGMEHGNAKPGKEGERAVIAAYRDVDTF
jgi:hydroxypyruvate isomerase